LSPSLSSVATRQYETGRLAAQSLIDALKNNKASRREQIDLGFDVIPRDTTAID
jgi:LacI family gluconate utilization system Gnt-I transcriptional repressor